MSRCITGCRYGLCNKIPHDFHQILVNRVARCSACRAGSGRKKCRDVCTFSTGVIRRLIGRIFYFVISITVLLRIFLRNILFGIITLPKRIQRICSSILGLILSIPQLIRRTGRILLAIALCFHPQNLRALFRNVYNAILSLPLLLRRLGKALLTVASWFHPRNLRKLCKSIYNAVLSLPQRLRQVGTALLSLALLCHPRNIRKLSPRVLLNNTRHTLKALRKRCHPENIRKCSLRQRCLRVVVKMAVYTVGISCCLCILTVILVEEVRAEGLRSLRLVEFDARIFQTAVPSVRRVVIVEEHHEVLKYWYEAAQDGIIPEEGLTLLRFDSHSGVSPLAHMDKTFPLFHWPTRLEELHHMIQESDDFVMAAALTKLFKRYVWVWPSWNAKNYASISGYEAYVVHIGWTNRFSAEDKREYREICGCLMNDKRNECRMRDYRNPKNSSFGLSITQEECNVVHRGILEVVRDDVAQEKLETEIDWLKPDEPLLLDIDADFYGSSSPEVELREVGVTKQFVHNISLVVGRIVCARSAQQETAADRLFGNLINTAQRYRHCMFRACPDSMNFVQLTQTALTLVTDMESESDYYGMFCTHNKRKLQALLEILLKLLLQLTSQQLHRLRWVGFCLQTSTKSFDYKPYDIFRVCTGKTGRHDYPSVTYHAPSKGEVINQTALLQDILYDGVIAPKFVTISRSVREGFAPRKHISLIESHVLATVFQVLNKNNSAVHYDKELFWGVHGWELRDKLVNTAGPIWNNVVL